VQDTIDRVVLVDGDLYSSKDFAEEFCRVVVDKRSFGGEKGHPLNENEASFCLHLASSHYQYVLETKKLNIKFNV
jgi:hypothetical protein